MSVISTVLALQDKFTNTINKAINFTSRLLNNIDLVSRTSMENKIAESMIEAEKTSHSASDAVGNVNKRIEEAGNNSDKFVRTIGRVKGLLMGAGIATTAKKVMELSDNMTSITSRLDLMNDGFQTTAELQNKIMQSANRSRTNFIEQADAVSKMGLMAGSAFSDNSELIAFTELIGKQFTIAGTSVQGQSAAMTQLTQAMASGVLRGEELNSIFEQAPTIIQTIADYLNVPIGSIRAMAAEGQISATVVKNAMLSSADSINKRFETMPMTFSQVATISSNVLIRTFQPVIQYIGQGATWIYNNWDRIAPIFVGVSAAVLILAAAYGIHTAALWLADEANRKFIVGMLASPVTWLAIGFGVLVGAIYKWVQSVGGAEIAWAIFCDKVIYGWNMVQYGISLGITKIRNYFDEWNILFKTFSVNFMNDMGDKKVKILKFFQGLINCIIGMLNKFISAVNKIPGVSFDLIEKTTFGVTAQLENEAAKAQRNAELAPKIQDINNKIDSRTADLNNKLTNIKAEHAARQIEITRKKAEVTANNNNPNFNFTPTNTGEIPNIGKVGEVGKISSDVNIADEDLKLMKDVAEMRYVQNFVTLEPKVSMSATVNKDADFDAFYDKFGERVLEELEAAAEGTYGG